MRRQWWRMLRAVLAGAVLASTLFVLYLAVRRGVAASARLNAEPLVLEQLVLVALLGALASSLAIALTRRSYRRLLGQTAQRIAVLRQNPAPHGLHELDRLLPTYPELAVVHQELEELTACYRKALADVVEIRAALETASAGVRRDDAVEKNPPTASSPLSTHWVVGSSRHRLVGRLAPNLRWMAATPPLLQFLDCTINDLIARPFLDIVHPSDAPGLERSLREALRDGEGHNITFRVLTPAVPMGETHGEETTMTNGAAEAALPNAAGNPSVPPSSGTDWPIFGTPLPARTGGPTQAKDPSAARREYYLQMDVMTSYTESGVPLHLRCHFIDITARVTTEQELVRRTQELSEANTRLQKTNEDLQRLKESYRDLYHHAPVLYFSLDPHGHFVACNETMLRTLGYPRQALLGQSYTRLLTPASRAAFRKDPTVFQRQGELETQWVKHDGTVIEVWIASTVIRDEKRAFVRSRSAARDMTDRKRLANALRAKAQEVGQANAQLRRINQELEDFTYVVSHDLKEPLRTLQAFSNFLAQDYGPALGDEGQEYINHLIQASTRLGALIDDLLTLSRAGRVINTPRPFSWEESIQIILADLSDLIQRQQATVRVEGPLPPVRGDPERVIQLLSNLISNGLKYNKSPHPEVVIGARQEEADDKQSPGGNFATIYVRDNGIGIDPAYHDQIFRMFRRLHRRDEIEGTGAGLTICKRIVEAHGGRLWVESVAGQGATFYFTLPRLPVVEVQASRESPSASLIGSEPRASGDGALAAP
jgi:PAS domain S-box-containing protein